MGKPEVEVDGGRSPLPALFELPSPGRADNAVPELSVPELSVPELIVEVRRSTRRRRTVSAYRDGDRTVVLVPARMSAAEEARWVRTMLDRLAASEARRRPSDATLLARALELAAAWVPVAPPPASVTWSTRQGRRWGSCTPVDRSIRLSSRLREAPSWVLDYVLVHELAHLVEAGHGPEFWAIVERFPQENRARAWLDGFASGELAGRGPAPQPESGPSCC
jgi:predicted metal-dependent hydrolase